MYHWNILNIWYIHKKTVVKQAFKHFTFLNRGNVTNNNDVVSLMYILTKYNRKYNIIIYVICMNKFFSSLLTLKTIQLYNLPVLISNHERNVNIITKKYNDNKSHEKSPFSFLSFTNACIHTLRLVIDKNLKIEIKWKETLNVISVCIVFRDIQTI